MRITEEERSRTWYLNSNEFLIPNATLLNTMHKVVAEVSVGRSE